MGQPLLLVRRGQARVRSLLIVAVAATMTLALLSGVRTADAQAYEPDASETAPAGDAMVPERSAVPGGVVPDSAATRAMPSSAAHAHAPSQDEVDQFADRIIEELGTLELLDQLAVFDRGRVVSFDSFASSMMRFISGPKRIDGHPPAFTYLDMTYRPERYMDRAVIYVKKKVIRGRIARVIEEAGREQLQQLRTDPRRALTPEQEAEFQRRVDERLYRFMEYGVISPVLLRDPAVADLMDEMSRDLLRTARAVEEISGAMSLLNPERLKSRLMLLPPPSGDYHDRWHTIDELAAASFDDPEYIGIPAELRADLTTAWRSFATSWGRSDADGVHRAATRLADLLHQVNEDPDIYPSTTRLELESWYFGNRHMTWVWLFYAVALVPLTLFVAFRWPGAYWVGLGLFAVAVLGHTAAFAIRWYISDRFPNSNMFEAVTTAAWFGAVFGLLVEVFIRRLPIRGLFAIGSGAAGMFALLAAHRLPLWLDPHISNRMPVLLDMWLYIHTNVIIFAYALVFMAAVTGFMYLAYRLIRWLQGAEGDWWRNEYARVGGAASLIMTGPDGRTYLERPKTTLGQVLDGTTMILVEVSFILLWAGIVMGAIWADHSWGRPWGWDPKEVFSLNTFLVFAVLIHARFKTQDKGLWTAIIAIVGAAVMLFNWVIINFTIAGLHSYA